MYTRVRVDRSERRLLPRSSGIRNDFRIWAGRDANSYTSRALCCVVNARARASKQPLRFIMNARGCTSRVYFRTTSWKCAAQRLTPTVECASRRYRDCSRAAITKSAVRAEEVGKRRTKMASAADSRQRVRTPRRWLSTCRVLVKYDVGILY